MTVDHGLQPGSAEQADRVVAQLAAMGVDETLTARVEVDAASGVGPEAAAREARYAVLEQVAEPLGRARRAARPHPRRPGRDGAARPHARLGRPVAAGHAAGLRASSRARCSAYAVTTPSPPAWSRASSPGTTRTTTTPATPASASATGCCPSLEAELGPGIAEALARTADQLREDTALLDDARRPGARRRPPRRRPRRRDPDAASRRRSATAPSTAPPSRPASPPSELTRDHVLAVDELLVGWRGQNWIDLPGPAAPCAATDCWSCEPVLEHLVVTCGGRGRSAPPARGYSRGRRTEGVMSRVFVVDDDRDILDLINLVMRRAGHDVVCVEDPRAAVILAESTEFDLAVLDWSMPRMDGGQLCARLRQLPHLAAVPILILTAHADSATRERAFEVRRERVHVQAVRAR